MTYDHFLADRIREIFMEMEIKWEERLTMGILCFRVDSRMCVGILDQRLIVKINPQDETAALAKPGCTPMYFSGQLMNGFAFIDPCYSGSVEELLEWLEFALKCNCEQNAPGNNHRQAHQG
jgi:hypothetical protein